MQQSYTNLPTPNHHYGKRFMNMLAGLFHATTFFSLWYGLSIHYTYALLVGVGGIALGLLHLYVGRKRALSSYRRAAAKQREEDMKQEILRLAQQSAPAQPATTGTPCPKRQMPHHSYRAHYKRP